MKKTIWIIVILIIVVAAVIWATNSKVEEPGENGENAMENGEEEMMENGEEATSTEGLGEDEMSDIDEQLEGMNDEGIECYFEEVDEDFENL